MTKEEKQLLLIDLCARLPHGFYVHRYSDNADIRIDSISTLGHFLEYSEGEDFKPYLRPISSMTEEERQEYEKTCFFSNEIGDINTLESYDWFNKKMFAYRTLDGKDMFELGIALKAPEGMYK